MTEWVIVVTWRLPEDGISAYGPYASQDDAQKDIPNVEPHFVNPYANQEEADTRRWHHVQDWQHRTVDECSEMGYEFGGYLSRDVEFHVLGMNQRR